VLLLLFIAEFELCTLEVCAFCKVELVTCVFCAIWLATGCSFTLLLAVDKGKLGGVLVLQVLFVVVVAAAGGL
jgi:hypothetical protein